MPFRVYVSYSHQDKTLVNRLLSHLAVLERDKLITVLYDEKIPASAEWDAELNRQL